LEDDGSKAAKKFYERVRTPLLTDVSIDWNGSPIADVYPQKIPDLFSAKPVVIHGRYTKGASGTIRLKGKVGGQDFVREIAVNLPETESRNDVLATLWARTRIDDLMSKDWNGVQNGTMKLEVQNTVTNIGLEYRLLTQFTSFVAVEEKIKTQGGKPVKVEVPVELPDGMNRENAFGRLEILTSLQRPATVKSKSISGRGNGVGSFVGGLFRNRKSLGQAPNKMADVTNLTLSPASKIISGGIVNGKAVNLPNPIYPPAAKAVRASGAVNVQIIIDEKGNVISASAISGHPLLRQAAEQAAKQAKFFPMLLSGKSVKLVGVIVYNFVDSQDSATVTLGELRVDEKDLPKPLTPEIQAELEKGKKEARYKQMLAEKLHVWLFVLIERLQKGKTAWTANEAKFVNDGKADVQIWFSNKTPAAVEKLKTFGFEVSEEKQNKILVGRIAIEKIAGLAEIAEVQYILPQVK